MRNNYKEKNEDMEILQEEKMIKEVYVVMVEVCSILTGKKYSTSAGVYMRHK